MTPKLHRWFKLNLGLYALFLLPTVLLLLYAGQSDKSISRHIDAAWQSAFWHFPGLGALASRIVLDVLTALAVAVLGGLFYTSLRQLTEESSQSGESGEIAETQRERSLLIWTAIYGAVLLAVIPFHSSDLYGYINRGFQQSLYHTNPYLTPVAILDHWQQDPVFHAHWIYNPAPYGFFFIQLTAFLTAVADRSFTAAFLMFKGLNWLLLLGCTGLMLSLSHRLNHPRAWLAAACFGLNPLVLLHVMGNGHNDILMVLLLLAALHQLGQDGNRWTALPLLTLSVLVKYASILALPFMLIYLYKQRDYHALRLGGLVSILLVGILVSLYVNFQSPWPWADLMTNAGKAQHSLVDMLSDAIYYPMKWLHLPAKAGAAVALQILKPLFWAGFIAYYAREVWKFSRQSVDFSQVVASTGITLTIMVALISAKFHPWYTVMFLPGLLLMPENSRWRQFGLWFSLFQLAGFTVFQNLPVISPLVLIGIPLWLAFRKRANFLPG